ncbi:MAG TPA: serine/threonine-protein kinase [Kofleriaceae bacterium]|nr:serine/threonine-protein kinase [Kofleriaceae bacterium]
MAQTVKPADAGVSIGQVFQGKYRVDSIVGHGGMGVVAECTHLALNERVAIKMLRQDVLLDQDAVSRFIREAQAAVKLKSEYVARVSDVGTFENGVPYMVMEFLEGHDLGELLKQRGVLPVQWAVELMLQTAEALAEAHSLNIVHRDVKPTNLFVTWRPDGSALIKVLDFGISKSPLGTDMQLTQTQSLLGTPAYMSPEQMRSARLVDTRTDIWSLGTVFYEILEGRRPFEAESFSEMCVKVAVDPPAPMINTPPGLQQVILRCLAKSPEQRYANMAELGRDLVPYSPDPHGAQMLVDRMARMLRRSGIATQADWDGSTGTGVGSNPGRVPGSARELGSGPVPRAQTPLPQQWGIGSDPAAAPWHGGTPRGDGSQPFARPINEASQPFARPLADDPSAGFAGPTVSTKKSRAPLIILMLALLAAAGVGIGFYATSGDTPVAQKQQTPDENKVEATQTMPVTPAETKTGETQPAVIDTKAADTTGTNAVDTKATDTNATDTNATDTKATDTKAVEAKASDAKVETKAEIKKTGTTKTGTAKTGTAKTGTAKTGTAKTDVKKTGTNAAGETAGETKEIKPEKKEPEKPCNPFASMHGCPAK